MLEPGSWQWGGPGTDPSKHDPGAGVRRSCSGTSLQQLRVTEAK
jgi:hypothetical protein